MKFLIFIIIVFSFSAHARLNTNIESMAGVTVATHDSTRCIPERLTGFIDELRTRFGSVQINSAYRNRSHNRQVGGARGSQHINCNAIDFVVPGVPKSEVRQFLIANFVGRAGVGFYCGNRFHIDVGPVRQWGGCPPGSDEIATARRRYSRYLTQRNRMLDVRVSEVNQGHRGYHRHENDNRIFVQSSAL